MTAGSVLGCAALLGVALASNLPAFLAAWLLTGTAMAVTFYQPAVTALTGRHYCLRVLALRHLWLEAPRAAPRTAAAGPADHVFLHVAAARRVVGLTVLRSGSVLGARAVRGGRRPW
jgi:hypothetical protein